MIMERQIVVTVNYYPGMYSSIYKRTSISLMLHLQDMFSPLFVQRNDMRIALSEE